MSRKSDYEAIKQRNLQAKSIPLPEPQDELQAILTDYRSNIADLAQDRHNRGITTEQLTALDTEASDKLRRYFAELLPPKEELEQPDMINDWIQGWNDAVDASESRILGGRHD